LDRESWDSCRFHAAPFVGIVIDRKDRFWTKERDMAKYLFAYHGGSGMAASEEEQAKVMAAWGAWYEQLGAAVVDGGAPVGVSKTVASDGSVSDGGGVNALTGFTVITAASLVEAVEHASGCPIREAGGSIEVAELIDM
jgi:hypothetical protein